MVTGKLADIIGKRFGRLVAKEIAGRNKQSHLIIKCICDCGEQPIIRGYSLLYGSTQSCGCLRREVVKKAQTKHNMSRTRFYHIWQGMKDRCYNSKSHLYKYYGDRNIVMCPRWKKSFNSFYKDMKNGYERHLTIDRIDNNGIYRPSNCRWVTQAQQMRNCRLNKFITFDNETKSLAEWLELFDVKRSTYGARVRIQGMTPKQALRKTLYSH